MGNKFICISVLPFLTPFMFLCIFITIITFFSLILPFSISFLFLHVLCLPYFFYFLLAFFFLLFMFLFCLLVYLLSSYLPVLTHSRPISCSVYLLQLCSLVLHTRILQSCWWQELFSTRRRKTKYFSK